jgi:phosphoribosylformylglycinamidine (FGAM) synthase PurS component
MGASSSFPINTNFDIYLSYSESNSYIERMMNTIKNLNFEVVDSSLMNQNIKDIPMVEMNKYIEIVIDKSNYIFVCISSKTINSLTQALEMNEIIDKFSVIQHKIIYFILESTYTPITHRELQCIIQKNPWFPIYDENTLMETTNQVLTLLLKN